MQLGNANRGAKQRQYLCVSPGTQKEAKNSNYTFTYKEMNYEYSNSRRKRVHGA